MDPILEPEPLEHVAAVVIATTGSPGAEDTLAAEPFRGGSLLAEVVRRLEGLAMVVVVVRDEGSAALADGFADVIVIVDPEWREGDSAPLRAGLDFLAQDASVEEAFVVSLVTPDLEIGALREVAIGRRAGGTLVAVPKYRYVRGGPVLLGREIWPRFLGAEGDLDIEDLLLAHPQWVTEVRVDWAPPRRISSHDDLIDIAR